MTRDELFELLGFLESLRGYDFVEDCMLTDELNKLIAIVRKALDNG